MRLKHWKLKALVQGALASMPGGVVLNDRLQTSAGDLRRFDENITRKVDDWIGLVDLLDHDQRVALSGADLLEIGSGWYPTLPLCFSLGGARSVVTVDLVRHLNPELTLRTVRSLEAHVQRIALAAHRPVESVQAVHKKMLAARTLESLLAVSGIAYRAPADAGALTDLEAGTFDVVYSNSVLEHVTVPALGAIFRETHRLLRDDGYVLHGVACNDHYAHFDRRISFVNYLQYSDVSWSRYNNDLHYQNRLRARDFLEEAHRCGFVVTHARKATRPGSKEAVQRLRIDSRFSGYTPDELAVTSVDFVARKGGRAAVTGIPPAERLTDVPAAGAVR